MTEFSAVDMACLRGQTLVFADLAFRLKAGEAMVLSGPNGSGKSSLLRVLAGLNAPFSGDVSWDGENVFEDRQAHADRLIYVGHLNAIKPPLTVRENLDFWAGMLGNRPAVADAMAAFDLTAIADAPGRVLSSGQGRRLNLARLCLDDRPLWLLDEPTVGLDVASCRRLEALIQGHRDKGGMVILSTHVGIDVPDPVTLDMARFSRTVDLLDGGVR
ncbi:heme ABC exporter ATP-binding protein CcmA [Aestuariispira insulae]|uniref:Heme exporter protein A n=1 Tax=Aestuariispira insulae TaxID=1461337 RepID=A0A3D9HQ80_9PROT|nr:heme ABC exporter ATP-binding protein CcmA [Aestuariispira insulae]RED51555.1 heme exporter protein A [Aestuariispira insulae]